MKTLKIVALFVGFSLANALPASVPGVQTAKDCMHFVLRVKPFTAPQPLFKESDLEPRAEDAAEREDTTKWQNDLTQADFMTMSVLASLASNTMISKNNSAFRSVLCTLAALHGSYFATQLWGNEANRLCSVATGVTAGAAKGAFEAFGYKLPQIPLNPIKVNKILATIIYLLGQNAPQFVDLLKEYWKGGLLNPMPFVRIFTKNRDRSELAAIAVRNILPLALLNKHGAQAYTWAKTQAKPHLACFSE